LLLGSVIEPPMMMEPVTFNRDATVNVSDPLKERSPIMTSEVDTETLTPDAIVTLLNIVSGVERSATIHYKQKNVLSEKAVNKRGFHTVGGRNISNCPVYTPPEPLHLLEIQL
jgi:hypothetical protein